MSTEPLLSVKGLTKHFPVKRGIVFQSAVGTVRAVDGLTFDVAPGETLTIGGLRLTIFEQDHHVMTTLGLRVGGFAYCTDVVRLPGASLAALAGIDTWVVDCFQRRPHPVHAHLDQVLEWVALLGPRRTILTHMSNDLDYARLAAELPPGIEPGVDGMELVG